MASRAACLESRLPPKKDMKLAIIVLGVDMKDLEKDEVNQSQDKGSIVSFPAGLPQE